MIKYEDLRYFDSFMLSIVNNRCKEYYIDTYTVGSFSYNHFAIFTPKNSIKLDDYTIKLTHNGVKNIYRVHLFEDDLTPFIKNNNEYLQKEFIYDNDSKIILRFNKNYYLTEIVYKW